MPGRARLPMKAVGRGLAVVVLANFLFLLLVLVAQGDRCVSLSRVQSAFETGDLQTKDFLWFDARRGFFQFNDCNVLQMVTNEDSSLRNRALAPRVFLENADWEGQCRVLRALTSEWVHPDSLLSMRYSRYWHGYNVVAATGLRHLELRQLRRVLSAAVWLGVGALAVASARSGRRVRCAGLVIAAVAATLWGIPWFAPGLTQGPGDAFLLFALATIAFRPEIATDPKTLVPFAAAFGAAVVFFEMLTGQLPIAIAWLAALTLAAARDEARPGGLRAPAAVLAAVVAFGLGALATVAAKLIFASVLAAPEATSDFASRLAMYRKVPEYADYGAHWVPSKLSNLPGIVLPFARLALKSSMLTYGSSRVGYVLLALAALAGITAAVLGWRARREERAQDRLLLVAAALVPAVWVCLLPTHTYIHATFMVRILVVPLSLAPLALFWPRARTDRALRERAA